MKMWMSRWVALATVGMISVGAWASDIVDTAVGAGNFKTLATALKAANLVETLKGAGPFTVFAPTDEAFAKLPKETIATLLKPENRETLAGILTYHVVAGKVLAKDVVELKGAVTINGQRANIKVDGSNVMIDGAKVVTTDIECDNGVIHVIDSVILPSDKIIPDLASSAGTFKTLLAAAKAAGLVETLGSKGPFTVFAPTDEAFAKLPKGTVETLLKQENKQQLVDILTYHVIPGRVYSEQVLESKAVKTLQGAPVAVSLNDGSAMINASKLIATDLDASNGVVHVIDSVLMPPAKGADAKKCLEKAVADGAPMFNAGDHAACATVYRKAMNGLMTTNLSSSMKNHMRTVIQQADHTHCPTERAWVLRRGIDQMYTSLVSQ